MTTNKESQNFASKSNENEEFQDPDIPDRSFGDYYCKLCDSHMNSDSMWEAHIIGKRHIKNVEKGDTESKYESLPNVDSSVNHELRNVKDPVVGCSYIHEIRREEKNVPSYFMCFLCHANVATVSLVIDHLLSLKHRLNYIKEIEPEEHKLIEATNLKKGQMEPLVLETVKKLEERFGRGTVKVKEEKKKISGWNYSTDRSSNFDDTFRKPLKSSRDDRNKVHKSLSTRSSYRERERSWSPGYFDDRFRSPPRSKSPKDFRDRKLRYSDDEYSDDDKRKTHFSRKNISPPRRDLSRRYDSDDEYLHSSRKSKLRDRMDISTRYENVKSTFDCRDHFQSSSLRLQGNNQSSHERSIVEPRKLSSDQPITFETVVMNLSEFSPEDCYKLFYERMKTLPEVSKYNEMVGLLNVKNAAEEKLHSSYAQKVLSIILSMNSGSDATETCSITPESTPKPSNSSNFLSELFKGSNSALGKVPQEKTFPDVLQSSYTPATSSHLSNIGNSYHAPSGSYEVPPVNSYQAAPTSSYTNQAQYGHPNASVPFASSSVQNFWQNVTPFNPTIRAPSQGRIFNFSHSSKYASSSGPKQFQRKF